MDVGTFGGNCDGRWPGGRSAVGVVLRARVAGTVVVSTGVVDAAVIDTGPVGDRLGVRSTGAAVVKYHERRRRS
ncbi:hypothetical protein FHS29_000212 [Saccharothrix tamanrassetensis]|uniref:Uncharacterized protein n=1 Tax=Saccharothrix tamanrassetensis TaxID=1051531 RepID=A0A841C537_9PSEU|nr:hypothetical protein [Saccharothrix tamanrassetensis]